jgi:hypothetical protein
MFFWVLPSVPNQGTSTARCEFIVGAVYDVYDRPYTCGDSIEPDNNHDTPGTKQIGKPPKGNAERQMVQRRDGDQKIEAVPLKRVG